jgi:hypothetical protein
MNRQACTGDTLLAKSREMTGKTQKVGSLKMNTALEYSTRVVQEGGRRCKKSTLNDLVHLTPLRIPLMNPPKQCRGGWGEEG